MSFLSLHSKANAALSCVKGFILHLLSNQWESEDFDFLKKISLPQLLIDLAKSKAQLWIIYVSVKVGKECSGIYFFIIFLIFTLVSFSCYWKYWSVFVARLISLFCSECLTLSWKQGWLFFTNGERRNTTLLFYPGGVEGGFLCVGLGVEKCVYLGND